MYYRKCSKCDKIWSSDEIVDHYMHTNSEICCHTGYLEEIDEYFYCCDCCYFIAYESWGDSDGDLWCGLLQEWILEYENGIPKGCPLIKPDSD